jgi:hypothetical protein
LDKENQGELALFPLFSSDGTTMKGLCCGSTRDGLVATAAAADALGAAASLQVRLRASPLVSRLGPQ